MDSFTAYPLRSLRLSPDNVRQHNPAEAVDELADDILIQGLHQNLVGHICDDADIIEICAGGRRLQALQLLLARGAIKDDHAVQVLLVDRDRAREVSLSENIQKVALNPADEYLAFARIVSDHKDDPDPIGLCARRQAVSRLRVERALRLANLAPEIFDSLRIGDLPVEGARAYASITDHKLQLLVFDAEERRTFGVAHRPAEIREALRTKTYPADCLKARYLGLAAYRAAGGRSDADLFAGMEHGERLTDTALLDKLVLEKAQLELTQRQRTDGFGDVLLTQGFSELPNWPPAPKGWLHQALRRSIEHAPKKGAGRIDCAGIYSLVSEEPGKGAVKLDCIGWYPKLREAALAGLAPPSTPREPEPAVSQERLPARDAFVDDPRIAERRLQLTAAHIAVERTPWEVLREHAAWPQPHQLVPAIQPGPDADTVVVAMLVHVKRSELEALLPIAADQIEDEDQANDRVTAAEGELTPISGGGARSLHPAR